VPDISTTAADTALGAVLVPGTTYYLSLYSADPGTTGANEISGGSYARQAIVFGAAAGGSTSSTDAQTFSDMPAEAGNLWGGIWTAATGGTFLWGDPTAMVTGPVAAGASITFASGAITASLS
jgi:hypothetical protein